MTTYDELAAAMRRGAALRPQVFKAFFLEVDGVIGSCALGAAFEGATGTVDRDISMWVLHQAVPVFDDVHFFTCPACGRVNDMECLITHLNDTERWTREQIADFLESLP